MPRGGAWTAGRRWADRHQNFYIKAAVLILQSRLNTTPIGGRRDDGKKANKWVSMHCALLYASPKGVR